MAGSTVWSNLRAKIIMTVQGPPAGVDMNSDAGQARYAAFMASMTTHFGERVDVWELWNEPDGTFWTGGQPATPAAYAGMLKKTYPAI
jgi:beta-glucosidase/6-phospho-beta-glucosidase/beta-galactosidase